MSSITNSSFDPHSQNITVLMADGLTPVIVSLAVIDSFVWYNAACSINYGAQAGACGVMFFVVLTLTKEAKRRTPIFILNILSLVFGFFRGLLLGYYFLTPWANIYPFVTDDYSAIPGRAYAISIATEVFVLLITITINMSLVLQAHTVCKNMRNTYRYIITATSCIVFLLAVGLRFTEVVTNSIAILSTKQYLNQSIPQGALYMETVAIWFFSIIFTAKLVYTLYYRRKNGWKQWSAVRILAAMGGCTMVLPALFCILEYVDIKVQNTFPEAGTIAFTMVALLLPLSSLWASMAIDQEVSSLNLSNLTGSNRSGSFNDRRFGSQSTAPSSGVAFLSERKGSTGPISPTTIDSRIEYVARANPRDSTEMDLEAMGVRVDKSYSVQSIRRGTN